MGKYYVEIMPVAEKHLIAHKKSGNKASINRIDKILNELSETPYVGIGKPEALKYELTGFWSRQINQKDRLIYKVQENIVTIIIISAMGHYE